MLHLIKGSNDDGDWYEFGTDPGAKEPPVLRLGPGGDYVEDWEGEDISWKWKDFEPILLVGVLVAGLFGLFIGIPIGKVFG